MEFERHFKSQVKQIFEATFLTLEVNIWFEFIYAKGATRGMAAEQQRCKIFAEQ